MKNVLVVTVLILFFSSSSFAVSGFREFKFGDSVETVKKKGEKLCRFGKATKDTRWFWKFHIECSDFKFKRGIKTKLFFQFSEDELVRIRVVSKDIEDYLLVRHPRFRYLVPLPRDESLNTAVNLADELMIKDKVHLIDKGYRYTTFFHDGAWEWEFTYELADFQEEENTREQDQLEEEEEKGLPGWKKFNFSDSHETIKEKVEGLCSSSKTSIDAHGSRVLICHDFHFMDEKIDLLFIFESGMLVKMELRLEKKWYEVLLPMLKQKYGQPFVELGKNKLYFPYIEFPKVGIVLSHRVEESSNKTVWISLKYLKEGYIDSDVLVGDDQAPKTEEKKKKGRSEEIMDSI